MSSLSIVRALCATNSRNEKERIVLEAFFAGEREFFVGVKLANDKLISFGVAKVAEILEDDDSDGDYTFAEFLQLCDDLAKRRLTGHAARDAIHNAAERCHTATWNEFYRRILLKDMKIGLEVKSINKVLKNISSNLPEAANYITPVFSPQLAHDGLKDEHQKYLRGKKYYDLKLDGCLSETWTVEFEDGKKCTIKEVVENRINGRIKSYNTLTNKIEFNEIIGWAKNGVDQSEKTIKWYKINIDDNHILPPLTGNHLVWLPELKCWRRVDLLKSGDFLLFDDA